MTHHETLDASSDYHETLDASSDYRTDIVTVSVDDGDNCVDIIAEDSDGAAAVRLTIEETLDLIAKLTGAVTAALANR